MKKTFTKNILSVLTSVMMMWIGSSSVMGQTVYLDLNTVSYGDTIRYCGIDTVILTKITAATNSIQWQGIEATTGNILLGPLSADSLIIPYPGNGWKIFFKSDETPTLKFYIYLNAPATAPVLQDFFGCGNFQTIFDAKNFGTGAYYSWSTGATTASITVTTAGTYFVDITNACGTIADTAIVSEDHSNDANLGSDVTTCGGTPLVLTTGNSNVATYLWSTGATTATLTVNNSGTYSVLTNDSNGCVSRDTIILTFTAPFATPEICMANFNIPTQKNEVIWVPQTTLGVNRIIVYKEKGTGNWVAMDTVVNTAGTWVDTTSHPQNSADSYCIGVEDTCKNVGTKSASHTTINLIVSYDPGQNITGLIWSAYLGMPSVISYYIINGIDTSGAVTKIDSVNGNILSYNYTPNPIFVKYFISFSATCGNWKTNGGYQVMSNITKFMDITVGLPKPVTSAPKPGISVSHNQVTIHGDFVSGYATDLLGRQIHQFTEGEFSLPTGVYIITLLTRNGGVIHTKVVSN